MRFAVQLGPDLTRKLRNIRFDRPVAEIWRELGREASRLGVYRPSYALVRLQVEAERIRRAQRDAAIEVAASLAFTRSVQLSPEGIEREFARAVGRRLRPTA